MMCCRVVAHCRRTSWRCFLAAVCATFTLSQLSGSAQHGMIGFTGIRTYENKDWLMQLPFILVNAGQYIQWMYQQEQRLCHHTVPLMRDCNKAAASTCTTGQGGL